MELKGQVEDFIFQNESNSYSIAILDVGGLDPLTIVGYLPFVAVRRYHQSTRKNGSTSRLW